MNLGCQRLHMLNAHPVIVSHSACLAISGLSFGMAHELIADELNRFLDRTDQRYKVVIDKFIFRLKMLQKEILESFKTKAIQLSGLHIEYQCKDAIDAAIHARNVPANVLNAVGVVEVHGGGDVFIR